MHESKGQHIGKAPSLLPFHTTFRQCMGVSLKCTTSCLGMRLKPCHVFLQHCHKSVLTVAPLLHAPQDCTVYFRTNLREYDISLIPTHASRKGGKAETAYHVNDVRLKRGGRGGRGPHPKYIPDFLFECSNNS